jgi:hypothetical protein
MGLAEFSRVILPPRMSPYEPREGLSALPSVIRPLAAAAEKEGWSGAERLNADLLRLGELVDGLDQSFEYNKYDYVVGRLDGFEEKAVEAQECLARLVDGVRSIAAESESIMLYEHSRCVQSEIARLFNR